MNTQRIGRVLVRAILVTVACCLPLAVQAVGQNAKGAADKIVVDGSTTVGPIAKAFAEFYMALNPDVRIVVSESGSGNGAKSLINGACDVADMSRFMKSSEYQAAVANSVYPVAHVVAMDGIAVIVHPANQVSAKGLTMEQLKNIYLGKITNWKALGGPDQPIVLVSRDVNSGTYETFHGLVMEKEKEDPSTTRVNSNGAMRERIASTENAIGYIGLGFINESVRPVDMNGVEANRDTIASGKYPVARPLFMFTDGYPKLGSHLHAFVTLHLSQKGQKIIEAIGFVPVTKY